VIAREGLLPVLASGLAAVLIAHFVGLYESLLFWLICLALVLVFRDPRRDIPSVPQAVVSPADGRIISVGLAQDPYLKRPSILVTLQMNPYGAYSTRSPVEGKVLEPSRNTEAGDSPHGVWLQTDEADDIIMVMNRGRLGNAPRCYVGFGERLGQGQRCGFIHFGGRIELYLPESSRTVVSPGDLVRSGSDIIANLVHR
jgi:phosphatidylserine decarboxylase